MDEYLSMSPDRGALARSLASGYGSSTRAGGMADMSSIGGQNYTPLSRNNTALYAPGYTGPRADPLMSRFGPATGGFRLGGEVSRGPAGPSYGSAMTGSDTGLQWPSAQPAGAPMPSSYGSPSGSDPGAWGAPPSTEGPISSGAYGPQYAGLGGSAVPDIQNYNNPAGLARELARSQQYGLPSAADTANSSIPAGTRAPSSWSPEEAAAHYASNADPITRAWSNLLQGDFGGAAYRGLQGATGTGGSMPGWMDSILSRAASRAVPGGMPSGPSKLFDVAEGITDNSANRNVNARIRGQLMDPFNQENTSEYQDRMMNTLRGMSIDPGLRMQILSNPDGPPNTSPGPEFDPNRQSELINPATMLAGPGGMPSQDYLDAWNARQGNPTDPGLANAEHGAFSQDMVNNYGALGRASMLTAAPLYGAYKALGQGTGMWATDASPASMDQVWAGMSPALGMGGGNYPSGGIGTSDINRDRQGINTGFGGLSQTPNRGTNTSGMGIGPVGSSAVTATGPPPGPETVSQAPAPGSSSFTIAPPDSSPDTLQAPSAYGPTGGPTGGTGGMSVDPYGYGPIGGTSGGPSGEYDPYGYSPTTYSPPGYDVGTYDPYAYDPYGYDPTTADPTYGDG